MSFTVNIDPAPFSIRLAIGRAPREVWACFASGATAAAVPGARRPTGASNEASGRPGRPRYAERESSGDPAATVFDTRFICVASMIQPHPRRIISPSRWRIDGGPTSAARGLRYNVADDVQPPL